VREGKTVFKKRIAFIFLLSLIFATLAFIFSQSALPPETSQAESEAVGGIIEEIIPPDTQAGAYVQKNIRKIAHFTEFALLGTEIALFVALFMCRPSFVALSYPFALIIAFFDESIQMFSRRGPAIFDVWIDFLGFFTFATIVYAMFFTVKLSLLWFKKRKENS
jgi:VanZ family protein